MILTIAEEGMVSTQTRTARNTQHGLAYHGVWYVLSLKIGNGGILNVLAISSFEPLILPLRLNTTIILAT